MVRLRSTFTAVATILLASSALAQSGPPRMEAMEIPPQPGALPLYPNGAPPLPDAAKAENWGLFDGKFRVVRNVTVPTITPYLPHSSRATGAAVVIAPGGGFMLLSIDSEGEMLARWLAERGVAAFLLKYRVRPTPADIKAFEEMGRRRFDDVIRKEAAATAPAVFQPAVDDGIASMRYVRARAKEWGVDPNRVGMIGFSAGARTAFGVTMANQAGARPDFLALIYGPTAPTTVPADAPPLFAAVAADDPLFGGLGLIESWRKARRPLEFHLYQNGDHGFGMRDVGTTATLWPDQFLAWMRSNKLLAPAK